MVLYTQYRPNGDYHMPTNFTLEVSTDNETYTKVQDFVDVPRNGTTATVDFDETAFRYYRLTVTGSTGSHVILGEIQMWRVFEVNGAKLYSPSNDMFKFYGGWRTEQVYSDFGFVSVGKRGANVKFEFEGTRFGIKASDKFGSNFEVYVDGKRVSSVPQLKPLSEQKGDYGLAFLTEEFNYGFHTVEIKCIGEANVDAFVIYE